MTTARGTPHRGITPQLQGGPITHVKRAPFFAVAVSFAAGILITEYLRPPIAGWLFLASAGLALSAGGFFLHRRRVAAIGLLLGFCSAGGTIYQYRCVCLPPDHIAEIIPGEKMLSRVRGHVCTDPVSRRKAPIVLAEAAGRHGFCETAFDLELTGILADSGPRTARGKVKVKLYQDDPGIRYGDEVVLTGEIQIPNSPTNPSQFDYRNYLRRQGIRAILYVRNAAGVEWTGRSKGRLLRGLFAVRRRLITLVAPPGAGAGAKVLAAMLLGAREELPPLTIERFEQSGTMHLLAISGLHVGMVWMAVWLVAGLTGAGGRLRSLMAITFVVGYVLLTGARPPAVRAAVMIVVVALGGVFTRRQITINSLALAAFIILLFSPGEIFMRGFQLSFVAVVSIIYFYGPIRRVLDRLKSPLEELQAPEERSVPLRLWIAGKRMFFPLVSVSAAAAIGVVPLIAHTFHIVSIIGILCNAILVPLATLVVWAGMAGLAGALPLSLFWRGAGIALKPAAWSALALQRGAELAASMPGSHFYTAGPPAWFLAAYYAFLFAVVHRDRLRLTPRRCAILGLVLLNVLALDAVRPDRRRLEATCFDVRHGACTLFLLPSGKTLLCDCGTASMFFDVGDYVVAPELWRRGIRKIDALILSHSDADHINGVFSLLKKFRIGTVFHPPGFDGQPLGALLLQEIAELGIARRRLTSRQMVELDDTKIEVFNPPESPELQSGFDSNNRSLVVSVCCSGKRFLLCADIQTPAIAWLLASGHDLRADVIFMPHHGSFYSNLPDFLRAVGPRVAIMSCERGYVQAPLINALETNGIRAFETADGGAIRITIEDGRLKTETFVRR